MFFLHVADCSDVIKFALAQKKAKKRGGGKRQNTHSAISIAAQPWSLFWSACIHVSPFDPFKLTLSSSWPFSKYTDMYVPSAVNSRPVSASSYTFRPSILDLPDWL